MSGLAAAGLVVVAWWASTGAILVAVRLADQGGHATRRALTIAGLPLLLVGGYGLWATAAMSPPEGACLAFLAALAVWGWVELAFLTGSVTGPNTRPCRPGVPGWERFVRAWGTLAYHEMLLAAIMAALLIGLWEASNTVGLWTFATLFAARISAKLNLFLGVPRFHAEFLPAPLSHLPSHVRIRRPTLFWPASALALALAATFWTGALLAADPGEATGPALLAALTTLALVEHIAMVLPVADEKLWRWLLPSARPTTLEETRHGL